MGAVADKDVLAQVTSTVETTFRMPKGELDVDADFETFGIDSIIAMELMTNLTDQFEISITPAQFTNINTVRELANLIGEMLAGEEEVEEEVVQEAPAQAAPVAEAPKAAVQAAPQVTKTATAVRQASRGRGARSARGSRARGGRAEINAMLDFVEQKYGIDMSYQRFDSADEIVDALLNNHTGELMLHYNIDKGLEIADAQLGNMAARATAPVAQASGGASVGTTNVAIVGMACRFPDAPNPQAYWDNLINERSAIREIPKERWDASKYYAEKAEPGKTVSKWGALIDGVELFDPDFFKVPAQSAKILDPQERLLMQEVYKAFEDAGMDVSALAGSNTGVFVGYEYAEYEQYLRRNIEHVEGGFQYSSSSPTYYLANRLSFVFDFHGPSESININCASSAVAINRAYYSLLNGESNVAVAGATILNLFVDDYIYGSQYGMLSPTGTCAVFDTAADGFTRGEGVAAIVLKRLDDAERDNNRIYGVIRTSHQNNRGIANDLSEIKHESITKVLNETYEKAGLTKEDISYIEVDGYSTKWGDSFEFEGIRNAFQGKKGMEKHVALGSVKGNIGHLEPASGMASVIKMALSMYNKQFPATITKKKTSEFIDIDGKNHPLYIAEKPISFDAIRKDGQPIRAGVNSFADSGANVHIIIEEYMSNNVDRGDVDTGDKQLFVLSAKNQERLLAYIDEMIAYASSDSAAPLLDMAYTSQVSRASMPERVAVIASSRKELADKLTAAKNAASDEQVILEDKGIYLGNINNIQNQTVVKMLTKDLGQEQLEQHLKGGKWAELAMLWLHGVNIPWNAAWQGSAAQRASLPSYPFAQERHWLDVDGEYSPPAPKRSVVRPAPKPELKNDAPKSVGADVEYDFSSEGTDGEEMAALDKMKLFLTQELARELKKSSSEVDSSLNFIELGVDSIGITNVMLNTVQLLNVSLSPSVVFRYPDINQFAQHLAENYQDKIDAIVVSKKKIHGQEVKSNASATQVAPVLVGDDEELEELSEIPPLVPINRDGSGLFELSTAQEKMYFLDQMEEGGGAHNVPFALTIKGKLVQKHLQDAFALLIQRHESLRTVFTKEHGRIQQRILETMSFSVDKLDVSKIKSLKARQEKAKARCLQDASKPFDIANGPLLRATLIKMSAHEHVLMLNLHHIISDGWSMGVVVHELTQIMDAFSKGQEPKLMNLPVQYVDYIAWLKRWQEGSTILKQRLEYWQDKLADVPAVLDLAPDYPRPTVQNYDCASVRFTLDTELGEGLTNVAKKQACTQYMALLTAFKVLFSGYAGSNDICIGSVNANRDQFETAGLIGSFFNVVPLRNILDSQGSFNHAMSELRFSMLDGNDNQLPIEDIMDRLGLRNANIVNVLFNQLGPDGNIPQPFGSAEFTTFNYGQEESLNMSDMSVFIGAEDGKVLIELVYSKELYHANTIERLVIDFKALVARIVSDAQAPLAQLIESANIYQRRTIKVTGTYTVDPVVNPTSLVAKRLPGKPTVSVGGYNQVIQELMSNSNKSVSTHIAAVLLEDAYKFLPNSKLEDKKAAVCDYMELLITALSQSKAQSTMLLIHEISPERVATKAERDMLNKERQRLIDEVRKIKSVTLIDEADIEKMYPSSAERYAELTDKEGHVPFSDEHFNALAMSMLRAHYDRHTSEKKVIVLDCDNTLWQGIVGEDGVKGIKITDAHKQLQQQIKAKQQAGYLIALCSKNNPEDVANVFAERKDMVLKHEDIVLEYINWEPKSQNVQAIANTLKIGLEDVVFIDDNPVEVNEMREHCPQVLSLQTPAKPEQVATFINDLWCFDKTLVTTEDQHRTEMVKENMEREKLAQSVDYASFIKQLNVKIDIADMTDADVSRVSQLTMRTNQFNANKQVLNEAQVQDYGLEPHQFVKTVKVTDKFGDYGMVGVLMYKQEGKTVTVEQFLLSCRALGREVEDSMLKHIAVTKGVENILVCFSKTERNQPVEQFLTMLPHERTDTGFVYQAKDINDFDYSSKRNALAGDKAEAPLATGLAHIDSVRKSLDKRLEESFLMDMALEYRTLEQVNTKVAQYTPKERKGEGVKTEYVAPRNETEMHLVNIWSEILGMEPESIGVNDDFFDCGGHSQLALKLIAKIEAQLGKALPLAILFTASTVATLAEQILSDNTTNIEILVPMQTEGKQQPIFALPGAGGSVVALQPFSQAFGNDQPFFGLQSIGLDGRKAPLNSVQEIAEANIEALKSVQPEGPYHFLGYSNGGVVAFEMTRMLQKQGDEVASIVMLDSLAPKHRVNDEIAEIVDVCKNVAVTNGGSLDLTVEQLRAVPEDKRGEFLFDIMREYGMDITKEQFAAYYNVSMVSERVCREYKPGKLPKAVDVTLFKAIDSYEGAPKDYGWNQYLGKPIKRIDVEANHLSIIEKESIETIVKAIKG
ncbi:HAD-IIIC family phosphatase [Paraneptunicella aestuarii]|uniref:HAD-IIIC family phosphatase n=1 Tax=Paraneptunicella aestuarii TaxID=2831148 RepID=UPI001E5D81D7|nr:HAD-IIIC family phosphatase [Paraneptunicella aestuarii]UAA37473.1 HAD-IIIC family phosphatase [Paraneptunicella aestuarii]